MNMSEIFIRRPIATALLMAAILLFGMVCYELLPVAALPNVDFPTIVVTAQLPGASPNTMADTVATPLEDEFTQIPGLSQMTSTSGLGQTTITLQFDLSVDINAAAAKCKPTSTPPAAYSQKPAEPADLSQDQPGGSADPHLCRPFRRDAGIPTRYHMPTRYSDNRCPPFPAWDRSDRRPATAGRDCAGRSGSAGLARIQRRRSRLRLAPRRSISERQPGGPHQQFTLDTNDQLFSASQFRNVIVAYQNGAPVKVKDVGDVINSSVNPRSGAWFDGKRAELLLIYRAAGANTVQVVDQVEAHAAATRKIDPAVGPRRSAQRPIADIRASVSRCRTTLMLTIVLVVLIIFAFLRKPWATAIPSVTVPLSIVATFGAMYLFGYSIDNLSLMGMSIAVGFVVDDAIVMIENIVRYIEAGKSAFEAALKGAGQIGFTIVSITFSLIAVFIPLLFMSGIIGRLFHEFAMTVSIAVVASALLL